MFRPSTASALRTRRSISLFGLVAATAIGIAACSDDNTATQPTEQRAYGDALALGNGQVRSYVLKGADGKPTEIGLAFSEAAMEGLPAAMNMPMEGHGDMHEYLVALPASHGTPYKFIELDWNPGGHEPPGIYDVPHFDFHFYTITKPERDAIDPTKASYATEARLAPDAANARAFMVNPAIALGAPAEAIAIPRMGMHWLDTKAPELQGLMGNPTGYKAFTATYIHGAWNGKFIFDEPMITRAHILSKKSATNAADRDQLVQLGALLHANPAGYYPTAYRIAYDAASKEYRIALTGLTYRE